MIIAGGRDFDNYDNLVKVLDKLPKPKEIVSGKARGADSLGEVYALDHGITVAEFPADWDKFGKSAGHVRNQQMADYADILVAFWDGESKGTKSMIKKMNALYKPALVCLYDN